LSVLLALMVSSLAAAPKYHGGDMGIDLSAREAGRAAADRHAWHEAFDRLCEADRGTPLEADDLDALAEAAWWSGRMSDCIAARERAFAAYQAAGNSRRAMKVAAELADHHMDRLEMTIAGAWLQRALKLREQDPDCAEAGYVTITRGMAAFGEGDLDAALAFTQESLDLGTHHGDRDLMALSLALRGMVQVWHGEPENGMALLDEATIAAVSGELGPRTTGLVYCIMISACSNVADYQRAGEWSEAARRWCERQSISGFPGVCRVHHAEVLRLRGSLTDAEAEVNLATSELRDFNLMFTAHAFHELGEIRLRMGDYAAAEDAFNQAQELGTDPQPGFAMLQLRLGKPAAAATSLKRSLANNPPGTPQRPKLLPTLVDVAIAMGDHEGARAACEQMREAVKAFTSPAMKASAAYASASVALMEGEVAVAQTAAEQAIKLWRQIDMPYETARSRGLLGEAFVAEGDPDSAKVEFQAARTMFEKLGAGPDALEVNRRLEVLRENAERPEHRRAAKTFMFTDIVNSTNLLEAIGDSAWSGLISWHDRTLRQAMSEHGGNEIKHTGDGFFVAFDDTEAAIACAVTIQRRLAEHRQTSGFAPQVRIGLHAAEATATGDDYFGKGVHESARIGAIATGDEIVISASSLQGARCDVPASEPRDVTLKGLAAPIKIASLLWRQS
jgi:class 3 adenylate cyclase